MQPHRRTAAKAQNPLLGCDSASRGHRSRPRGCRATGSCMQEIASVCSSPCVESAEDLALCDSCKDSARKPRQAWLESAAEVSTLWRPTRSTVGGSDPVYRDLTCALLTVWPIMFGDEDVLLGDSPRIV